jgi:transcription-repair coupling factor (superfamily II helicase)
MDRLICGDVGFGKTEVALRAAFAVALDGKQVRRGGADHAARAAAQQEFRRTFSRFPVNVAQASRLIPAKELTQVKKGLTDGNVDIVVGTHALLGKSIKFRDLGLLIVDEEQHFGVSHKERLKQLRAQVHVLTLSATPIPRTLQLALTGVRDLSIIASPPVDRLAVRTFVAPHDPLMIREALLRERYRGGQAFYVVPRIEDLAGVKDFLDKNVPEMKVAVAHGQMPPTVIEDIMSAFYDGKYDILLSTTIIESGLDIPTANTLIVHRADMFGLAQLYQLRGRVGRSKLRAVCAVHAAGAAEDHRPGRAAAEGAAVAGNAGRGLSVGLARPRYPRRRQSARRGAIRPHQGSRLRALSIDAGGGDPQPQGRRVGAGRPTAGRRRSPSACRC